MSYSVDLRKRVINFVLKGKKIQEAYKTFNVHYNTISKWIKVYNEENRLEPNPPFKKKPYKMDWEELRKYVEENPDLYQSEYAEHFGVSQGQVCKVLNKLQLTRKKKSLTYHEQDKKKVAEFEEKYEQIEDKTKIVYLDESGIKQSLTREYGYAKRGKKVMGKVAGKKERKLNIISALCGKEIIAPLTYEGNMNTELFYTYLETILLPILFVGSVIIMDRASYHVPKKIKELIESRGCKLLLLSPYSPELNKIEKYWAVLKRYVRRFRRFFSSLGDTVNFIFNNIFPFNARL